MACARRLQDKNVDAFYFIGDELISHKSGLWKNGQDHVWGLGAME